MNRRAPLLVALLGMSALACPSSDGSSPPPASIPSEVQRAFEGSCMHEGCHDATSAAAGLSLDAADSLAIVGGPSTQSDLALVVVGDLAGSYMAIKLLPDNQLPPGAIRHEERMPPSDLQSGDAERINTILSWIAGFGPSGTDGETQAGGGTDGTSGTNGASSGAADEGSTSGTTGSEPTSTTDPGPTTNSGGGPADPACSVEEVTEGVVSDPLDKGDAAGQIPSLVGIVLEERCGCHTLADRELNTKFPALLAPGGTLFLDYGDVSGLGASLEDAIFGTMSMPPGSCPSIPMDDRAVLAKWFMDGLPDGASFEPP
ncbi:MAG: hypothetical protein AAGF11_11550 [Myxococcota bacterium]